jgi:hypothetical protein
VAPQTLTFFRQLWRHMTHVDELNSGDRRLCKVPLDEEYFIAITTEGVKADSGNFVSETVVEWKLVIVSVHFLSKLQGHLRS